jgi:nucleoside phosphorylase
MVGIGGGMPYPKTIDIRLGDVVVCKPDSNSGGVVQYDFGKTIAEGKFVQTGRLCPPSPELLSIAGTLRAAHALNGSGNLVEHIKAIKATHLAESFYKYPGRDRDILYTADYDGPPGHKTCDGCEKSKIYSRKDRVSDTPKIFYGIIASGDQVMRHASTRDRYGEEQNVLCFEMEAAGLMDNYGCMVIRGICDYADSHKTKEWQNYAAIVAAAYGKEFLSYIAPQGVANIKPTVEAISPLSPIFLNLLKNRLSILCLAWPRCNMLTFLKTVICPYPENTQFVGRESILDQMMKELQHVDGIELLQGARTVALHGLGGVG